MLNILLKYLPRAALMIKKMTCKSCSDIDEVSHPRPRIPFKKWLTSREETNQSEKKSYMRQTQSIQRWPFKVIRKDACFSSYSFTRKTLKWDSKWTSWLSTLTWSKHGLKKDKDSFHGSHFYSCYWSFVLRIRGLALDIWFLFGSNYWCATTNEHMSPQDILEDICEAVVSLVLISESWILELTEWVSS